MAVDKKRLLALHAHDADVRFNCIALLIKVRQDKGITEKEMARRMETTISFIRAFENGASDAHLSTYQRYARALNCTVQIHILREE